MTRPLRVLIVDDDEEWRSLLSEVLEGPEFEVESAASVLEAKAALERSFFHLLTLDIRLQDADEANIDGFELLHALAEEGQNEAMKIIVISHFGTDEQVREAFRDYDVIDFVRKSSRDGYGFDNRAFLQNLRAALSRKFALNLALRLYWQGIDGPTEAVQGIQIKASRLRSGDKDSNLFRRIADELEDLLCRLFYDSEEVLLRPLPRGQGGGGLLLAEPQYAEQGAGQPVVVKYGDAALIHREAENFRKFVSGFVGGHRAAQLSRERRTSSLGGIVYSLLGQEGGRFRDLESFYESATAEEVIELLQGLFMTVCGTWYANVKTPEPMNLSEDYSNLLGLTVDNLETALSRGLGSVQGAEQLKFNGLKGDRRFLNPIRLFSKRPIFHRTCKAVTHGDLNHSNIIIDEQANAWLIDFQFTGWGHFLRDFARLDSVVRFRLLRDASLDERLELEEALCSVRSYSELPALSGSFRSANSEIIKAFLVSMAIRKMAAGVATRGSRDDFFEYHLASFFFGLNWIRYFGAPRLEREHAILSAALLSEALVGHA